MATLILRPSTATLYDTTNTSITNSSNIWDGDSSTYATFSPTKNDTTTYYLWISGFNFSSIPANATISAVQAVVKISATRINTSLYPAFYNNGTWGPTKVELGTFDKVLTDSSHETTATMTVANFETFKGYGNNAIIGIPIRKSSSIGSSSENIYEVYIEVTYTATTNNTRVGSSTPSKFYVGGTAVDKIYQGNNLIYGG